MQSALNRQRLTLITGITAMVVLSWLYLIDMAVEMAAMPMEGMSMEGMSMEHMVMPMSWGALELALLFVMWAVMMVAMMLPSATPMILTFLSINQKRQSAQRPVVPTYIFIAGYLVVWTAYSLAATALQWVLHEQALITSGMATSGALLSGLILIVAGGFQLTPLKNVCLQNCRSPLTFLMSEWREGYRGAFVMGLRHGSYCVGCCWALMLLLFVAGVMNLLAVALIAVFVLLEKLVPKGELVARASGSLLILAGLGVIAASG